MDPSQFDTALCAFTLTRSRRGLGSALAGLVLGGALGSVALEAVAAKKKKKKPKCKKSQKRCGKFCISKELCCKNKDCGCFATCSKSSGTCGLPPPDQQELLAPLGLGPCQTYRCDPSTNTWSIQSCNSIFGEYCCEGQCKHFSEACCEGLEKPGEPKWTPCPGEGRCCGGGGRCTDSGNQCCEAGLKVSERSCCAASDTRCH